MLAYTYLRQGEFALLDKPKPQLQGDGDAIVRVTLSSICTSDLHIKHGSVPRAVPGITVGHEMVGVVEEVGAGVSTVQPGDRVTVNVETFCGQCFFCRHGWVNNCTDPNGGWALGCRIDGGQAEYVRVPYADQGLNNIPDSVYNASGTGFDDSKVLNGTSFRPEARASVNTDITSYDPDDNITVTIVGVMRVKSNILTPLLQSGVAYTEDLVQLVLDKAADVSRCVFRGLEKLAHTQLCMAGAFRIAEGVPAAQLLKSAQIMQQTAQPGEVDVARGERLARSDARAQVRHAIGVRDLERDARVARIVGLDVAAKRLEGVCAVDFHAVISQKDGRC